MAKSFVAKVFNGEDYVPLVPTATGTTTGTVTLTDTDKTSDAGSGIAVTPKGAQTIATSAASAAVAPLTSGSAVVGKAKALDNFPLTIKYGNSTFTGTASLGTAGGQTITLNGTLPIAAIPKEAQERLVTVANQTARFALTVNEVQLGDVVQEQDTRLMYYVKDTAQLNNANGYAEFVAGTASKAIYDEAGLRLTGRFELNGTSEFSGTTDTCTLPFRTTSAGVGQPGGIGNITLNKFSTGKAGVVPAPTSNDTAKFLRGDGTWQTVSIPANVVTSVNGKAGPAVTLAASDVNALPVSGGTLTGNLTVPTLLATNTNSVIGSSAMPFATVYGKSFSGNAASATNLNKSVRLNGDITSSAYSLNNTNDTITMTTSIADGSVAAAKLAGSAVTTSKIANNNVTLNKLSTDLGIVQYSATQPTDSRVAIWINTAVKPSS